MYEFKNWAPEELGKIYGLSGVATETVAAGKFVKFVGSGSSISPMRFYLKRNDVAGPSGAPGLKGNRMKSIDENLPEDIEVYINRGEDEGPLFVGTINTRTGEFRAATDRWFDLKGRKLNGKPTVKGTYYHNNKLEIIK